MVRTRRNGQHDSGSYRLIERFGIRGPTNLPGPKIRISNLTPKRELTEFLQNLKYEILRLLKSHRKINPFKNGHITLSDRLALYLKSQYRFTGRFKEHCDFLSSYQIPLKRYFNDRNYSQVYHSRMRFRLWRKKEVKYVNANGLNMKLKSPSYFSFKFGVEEVVNSL